MSRAAAAGLCGTCMHARTVRTKRGSVFILCQRSKLDPAFPRYPRLPVQRCHGHEREADDMRRSQPGGAS